MGKAGSGYKKPANKKTSKKDIMYISLVVGAIVALIAIFAVVVSNDDFIRSKNGVLQMDNNWLVSEYARNNGTAWYKIGEIGEIEGYTMAEFDTPSDTKYIYPTDFESNVSIVYVGTAYADYEEMVTTLTENTAISYGLPEVPSIIELTIADRDAAMFNCVIPCDGDEFTEETAEVVTEEATEETTEEATEEVTEETTEEVTEEATEETTEEATEETAEEVTEEATEETAEEVTEETADEHDHAHDHPGSIIYACIDYDGERCVYIQVNTVESITDEEAQSIIETIGAAITLIER